MTENLELAQKLIHDFQVRHNASLDEVARVCDLNPERLNKLMTMDEGAHCYTARILELFDQNVIMGLDLKLRASRGETAQENTEAPPAAEQSIQDKVAGAFKRLTEQLGISLSELSRRGGFKNANYLHSVAYEQKNGALSEGRAQAIFDQLRDKEIAGELSKPSTSARGDKTTRKKPPQDEPACEPDRVPEKPGSGTHIMDKGSDPPDDHAGAKKAMDAAEKSIMEVFGIDQDDMDRLREAIDVLLFAKRRGLGVRISFSKSPEFEV